MTRNPSVNAVLEKQEDVLHSLEATKRDLDVDMLVQCRLNSTHFEGLRDKKRRAQQLQSHMQLMLQEFKLMQKQLEEKAKQAKKFKNRAETIKELNDIKMQRKTALKTHRQQQDELNQLQITNGKMRKEQSMEAKDNLSRSIWKQKHQQYLESRNNELEGIKQAMGDLGSDVNKKIIRARDSKIEIEQGKIVQRKYIKGKLESLDQDLVSRIDSKTHDIEMIWTSMQMIERKQKEIRERLRHVDSEFVSSQKELEKLTKLSQFETKILKKPTLTKDFSDFDDKVRKGESLYRAESRKNSEYKAETESVQKGAKNFYKTATMFVGGQNSSRLQKSVHNHSARDGRSPSDGGLIGLHSNKSKTDVRVQSRSSHPHLSKQSRSQR